MAAMLNNPEDELWKDVSLETKLKQRLPGALEYETYMITVSAILNILKKIQKKLKLNDDKLHWTDLKAKGRFRIGFEAKRVAYVLDSKRRARLMDMLGRYNDDLRQLLGNSDRLEPTRRKRKTLLPSMFEKFRKQAISLHEAICQSLHCECSSTHAAKLLLPRLDGEPTSHLNDSAGATRIQVYFPRKLRSWSSSHTLLGPDEDWYAADVEMADSDDNNLPNLPHSPMPTQLAAPANDLVKLNTGSTLVGFDRKDSFQSNRKVLFEKERRSSSVSVPKGAIKIQDLCASLKTYDVSTVCLGYIKGNDSYCHTIYRSQVSIAGPDDIHDTITLGEHIRQSEKQSASGNTVHGLRRHERIQVALTMARNLLQLFQCPWLSDTWSKDDIVFFRDRHGRILPQTISLDTDFHPKSTLSPSHPLTTPAPAPKDAHIDRKRAKASLLSLGVLILELWFYKPFESCHFRNRFLGPDGQENEFTQFNTAQVWQEQALEEGGIDLDNLTYRCIHGDFGTAKQDLNDEELKKAVYCEVVQPLERILARYE